MPRNSFGRLPLSLLTLMGLMILGVTASESTTPSPSPSAEVELICHTDNPAECYPKIFQATDEFQKVHDDQDLPIGLHVRLNVQTGTKEAKINVPDEIRPDLEGLPVDKSVVIIDPETRSADDDQPKQQVKIPSNAPAYDPVGTIKTPKSPNAESETNAFYKSLKVLRKGLNIDEALEMLEDISHDIYYGLKIAEDYDTVRQLFCLANTGDIFTTRSSAVQSRARLAALTLASAVQNNPKALAEIEKHWATLKKERCPGAVENLGTATFRLVAPPGADGESDPALVKVRVAAISGLLKSDAIRGHFLANGGMELLLEVLVVSEEAEWELAQRKVGLLVLDNFLDEDMGAALGEWPTGGQDEDNQCAARQGTVTGECWDWHAKQLADRHKGDKNHWTGGLLRKLKEQRKVNGGGGSRGRAKVEL